MSRAELGVGVTVVTVGLLQVFLATTPSQKAVAQSPSSPTTQTQSLKVETAPEQHKWFVSWEAVDKGQAPSDARSFRTSTKKLQAIYDDSVENRTTLYCGCKYDDQNKVDYAECGYTSRSDSRRSHRSEIAEGKTSWSSPDSLSASVAHSVGA